jgi:hypothetical protein
MKNYLYFLIFTILFSCSKTQKKKEGLLTEELKPSASIIRNHEQYKNVKEAISVKLDNWKQYRNLSDFIKKFNRISANEALNNGLELKDLVESLRDSLKPTTLEVPSFNARVNILHNEALRLSDMTFISAITPKEVHAQVNNILYAFSCVNAKINTIYLQKTFEDTMDIDDFYIGLDSTKLDTASMRKIQSTEVKEQPLKKKNLFNKRLKLPGKIQKKQ